jgi:hypothetical protein
MISSEYKYEKIKSYFQWHSSNNIVQILPFFFLISVEI